MQDDIDDRRNEPFFTPGVIAALILAVFLSAGLFAWAPWTTSNVAGTSTPGVTTGQSASAPRAAPAPVTAPTK